MNIFFSYSGARSKEVAEAFAAFVQFIFRDINALGINTDIAKGDSWRNLLQDSASQAELAIVFVTSENIEKPWLNYEMGFLIEKLKYVIPLLVDLKPSDLKGPLSQFQACTVSKDEIYKLVKQIHKLGYKKKIETSLLNELFNKHWPVFLEKIKRLNKPTKTSSEIVNVVGGSNIVIGHETIFVHEPPKAANKISEISSEQAFERIGAAVRQNLDQLKQDIEQARSESSQFFKLTIIFSSVGFIIVAFAIVLLLTGEITAGIVAAVASAIPEVTALLFFNKDKELRNTIESYHKHVLESQKMLTMVDVCETISNQDERDRMKQQIILGALDIA